MKKLLCLSLCMLTFVACGKTEDESDVRERFVELNVDIACNAPELIGETVGSGLLSEYFEKHGFEAMDQEEFASFSEPYFNDPAFIDEVNAALVEAECIPANELV